MSEFAYKFAGPRDARQVVDQLSKAEMALAYDEGIRLMKEGTEAASRLPSVEAKLEAVEKQLARPIEIKATLAPPAEPKVSQNLAKGADDLAFALAAELLRYTKQVDPEATLRTLLPGEVNRYRRKAGLAFIGQKAATDSADTTSAGWAQELVRNLQLGFEREIRSNSIFGALSAYTRVLDFRGAGSLTVPHRPLSSDGLLAAQWISEKQPIPVQQDAYGSSTFNKFKMAVISVFANEYARLGPESIADIIRDSILADTAEALDVALLDDNAETAGQRPAGLLNDVVPTASQGTDIAGIIGDITQLRQDLAGVRARQPLLIMNEMSRIALASAYDPVAGGWPFASMLERGQLFGIPVISSTTAPANLLIGLDPTVLLLGMDAFEFDTSKHAQLVMDSTGVDSGSAVTMSVFQADATALRGVMPVSFGQVSKKVFAISGFVG